MSADRHDIDDNEIRIISSSGQQPVRQRRHYNRLAVITIAIVVFFIIALTMIKLMSSTDEDVTTTGERLQEEMTQAISDTTPVASSAIQGYTTVRDTVINGSPLTILTPHDATPALAIGPDVINDPSSVLTFQAADIRADNGAIVGAFVKDGELVSRGQSKSGYCAIIDGNITIGVASATPCLEEAIETGGHFFRQYPLVVAGQVVENKPKGRSLRKALARLGGETVIILSRTPMTFHDFSSRLVDLGVTDAIYLVGSSAHGTARDADGRLLEFGRPNTSSSPNTNYIIWK